MRWKVLVELTVEGESPAEVRAIISDVMNYSISLDGDYEFLGEPIPEEI